MASLSTQTLNQFAESLCHTEELSAGIAGIYRACPLQVAPRIGGAESLLAKRAQNKSLKRVEGIPLSVSEP